MSKIVTIAARNVRPGDFLVSKEHLGATRQNLVLKVERVDWEDRIEVRITIRDDSTWVPSEKSWVMRLYHTVQVRKGMGPRTFMSWEPCYYDTTNRKKPLPARVRKLFGIR